MHKQQWGVINFSKGSGQLIKVLHPAFIIDSVPLGVTAATSCLLNGVIGSCSQISRIWTPLQGTVQVVPVRNQCFNDSSDSLHDHDISSNYKNMIISVYHSDLTSNTQSFQLPLFMRCVPASIGSNVAGHCFGCYHPKS